MDDKSDRFFTLSKIEVRDTIHINSWKYGEELGGGVFQTIDIKAYRGLKNITLQNLSRVNILVGENNTGKTSIVQIKQKSLEFD